MIKWDFEKIAQEACQEILACADLKMLEDMRIKFLGRKGFLTQVYASLSALSVDEKPLVGKLANDFRNKITQSLDEKKILLEKSSLPVQGQALDVSLPGIVPVSGREHILSQIIEEICTTFEYLGFVIQDGPEVESEFNNFTALNIPADHPSRDSFDTFYLETPDPDQKGRNLLLRSQTSPVQIRLMKQFKPPFAVVIPGKVYRPDAVDASHSFVFHQIEGLLVDQDIKFSDLKGLLTAFCQRLFGEKTRMRFRPHYFPFTEPSAEVDISCYICEGKGCSVCGRKGWLEIMGCGMVNPKVFEAVKYPKGKYTGLAFGMGVERMAMLKYGINDIRLFLENDVRFLKQF